MTDILSEVLGFLREERPEAQIGATTELMEAGLLDSIAIIKSIQFMEATFGIGIADTEIDPAMFSTPATIAAFVAGKLGVDLPDATPARASVAAE